MISVSLNNITKKFGDFTAVNDLDFKIESGEFFTFLGPSGCGKTTTLRMIAGFIYPTDGSIYFGDKDMTYISPEKRDTGMVFQNYALFPHLTVKENVAFGLNVRKVSSGEIDKRVEKALEQVHLSGLGSRKIHELSGGQQQRVALARAIIIEPQILLLDEPLSNLDAKLREETRGEIKKIQMELGITTIYVTHDQAEALAVSDRILIMNKGVLQQIGSPQDIYNRPNNVFVADFIGKSNILKGKIVDIDNEEVIIETNNGFKLIGLKKNKSEGLKIEKNQDIAMAIRPEAFIYGEENNYNNIRGIIDFSEFTGTNINYTINLNNEIIQVSFIGAGQKMENIGDKINLHIPKEMIYFIDEREKTKEAGVL